MCGCGQLPLFIQINSMLFLTSVFYHRELHFPHSLALWVLGWFSQWEVLVEARWERGEKPEYFSPSLSFCFLWCLWEQLYVLHSSHIWSTGPQFMVPAPIMQPAWSSRPHHMAPTLRFSSTTSSFCCFPRKVASCSCIRLLSPSIRVTSSLH